MILRPMVCQSSTPKRKNKKLLSHVIRTFYNVFDRVLCGLWTKHSITHSRSCENTSINALQCDFKAVAYSNGLEWVTALLMLLSAKKSSTVKVACRNEERAFFAEKRPLFVDCSPQIDRGKLVFLVLTQSYATLEPKTAKKEVVNANRKVWWCGSIRQKETAFERPFSAIIELMLTNLNIAGKDAAGLLPELLL